MPRNRAGRVRRVPHVRCEVPMEAATHLRPATVRSLPGDRVAVDGLVIDDATAVRLVREREERGDDPAALVTDAIEIGARVLDREQTGANAEWVKTEFEKAARELNVQFTDKARSVAEGMSQIISRHFADDSSEAVQHKVRQIVRDVS